MKFQSGSCVNGCEMEWYERARQATQLNRIKLYFFAYAMRDLLACGGDKFNPMIIVCPVIFQAFTNPAND